VGGFGVGCAGFPLFSTWFTFWPHSRMSRYMYGSAALDRKFMEFHHSLLSRVSTWLYLFLSPVLLLFALQCNMYFVGFRPPNQDVWPTIVFCGIYALLRRDALEYSNEPALLFHDCVLRVFRLSTVTLFVIKYHHYIRSLIVY
jgi:hypothetical protein